MGNQEPLSTKFIKNNSEISDEKDYKFAPLETCYFDTET